MAFTLMWYLIRQQKLQVHYCGKLSSHAFPHFLVSPHKDPDFLVIICTDLEK